MDKIIEFNNEVNENIENISNDKKLKKQSLDWNIASAQYNYTYNFRSLGRPII